MNIPAVSERIIRRDLEASKVTLTSEILVHVYILALYMYVHVHVHCMYVYTCI